MSFIMAPFPGRAMTIIQFFVLCSTAVVVLEELYGVKAKAEDFIPFAGMGEAKFLAGAAKKYGVEIDIAATKIRFFELYLDKAADPNYKIGYPGTDLTFSNGLELSFKLEP